jgi:hypothetical protein
MGDVQFKIEEINFDDDPEIIIAYKNTDRFYVRDLEDFIVKFYNVFFIIIFLYTYSI